MRIILYGEYNDRVHKTIKDAYIIAWIPDQGCGMDSDLVVSCRMICLEDLDSIIYDYILITGVDADQKFLRLLESGVKGYRIRTLHDLICERHNLVTQDMYFNELCLDNLKNHSGKRVLMVSLDLAESGAPVAFLNLACSLQRLGYQVMVYCQCDGPMKREFLKNGIPVCIEDLYNRESLEAWIHWENFAFAVVNTLLQYKLVKRFGASQLHTYWWLHECQNYYYQVLEVEGKMPQMDQYVHPVFVGEKVRDDFYQYFGQSLTGTELLYGLENKRRENVHNTLQREKIVFAVIGAIQYRKGQDLFVDAVRCLKEEDRKKCVFQIIGKSAFEDNYMMQHIREAERDMDEFEYRGELSYADMQKAYEEIDVVVCPSRIDPMPIVVTEGLMNHKICLISDQIGTAAFVKDGESGFVCKTEDVWEFAEKIQSIINHWQGLESIRVNGYKIYEEHFTIDKFEANVSVLLEILDEENKT